ncbi:MAG: MFS transporter, partial [Caulobacterales bacterium]|nr:MFS transporter [Caulobacterales bacterium]
MKQDRKELLYIIILFASWGVVFLDRMVMLYLSPYLEKDLNLNGEQLGQIAGATAISWAFSCFFFGAVSDKIGRKKVILPAMIIFSVVCIMSGFAKGFWDLLLFRIIMGAAEGPCWAVMTTLAAELSHPSRRGRNVTIVVSAGGVVGLFLGPAISTYFADHFGWSSAFIAAGLPGLILAFLVWKIIPEPKVHVDPHSIDSHSLTVKEFLAVIQNPHIWMCCLGASGYIGWLMLQNLFAPLYIVNVIGQPASTAGLLLSIAGIGNIGIGIISGILMDKIGRRPVLIGLTILSMLSPLLMLQPALYSNHILLGTLLFLTQGGLGVASIIMVLLPAEKVKPVLAASAVGATNLVGELLGGALMPIVGGNLSDRIGLEAPLYLAIGLMGVALIVAILEGKKKSVNS